MKRLEGRRVTRKNKGKERVTLRLLRQGLGKSRADLAVALATDEAEIQGIESRPDTPLSTLRRYAAALGATCEIAFVLADGRRLPLADPEPGGEPPK